MNTAFVQRYRGRPTKNGNTPRIVLAWVRWDDGEFSCHEVLAGENRTLENIRIYLEGRLQAKIPYVFELWDELSLRPGSFKQLKGAEL